MENKKVISTRDQLLHVAKDVTSSIVGSAACVYSGQPFDTIKGLRFYVFITLIVQPERYLFSSTFFSSQFECKYVQTSIPVPLNALKRPFHAKGF